MKSLFRFLVTALLAFKARRFLLTHSVEVIAITGSIGKTSTKAATSHVLKKTGAVHSGNNGFNTPIGLCLSILQEEVSGFSSLLAWLKILKRALFDKKPSYKKIVLEMGADHRGDIKTLMKIAPPKIAVVTHVAPVHLEEGQFKDVYDIAREKNTLIKDLHPSRLALVNIDDPLVSQMKTTARRVTYGLDPAADFVARKVHAGSDHLSFDVEHRGNSAHVKVPVLGSFQVHVLLPAIAVGMEYGMTLEECATALSDFSLPVGRMNPVEGINGSHIIDSSYNASPLTMKKALELLDEITAPRKIAALGTMNELGEMTKEAHLELGKQARKIANILIFVGPEAATLKQGALEAGMKEEMIYTFLDAEEAGVFLRDMIQSKDLILVKGSQNRVRMERLVKGVMKNPDQALRLLCRQGEGWK